MTKTYSVHGIDKDEYYGRIIANHPQWFNPEQAQLDKICGWSIDFQTYYLILRLLEKIKPRRILELGFGFSSLAINQYAQSEQSIHDICENDGEWIDFFNECYAGSMQCNYRIIMKGTVERTIGEYENCLVYDDFRKDLNPPYDFVLIDGPWGGNSPMPRTDLLTNLDILDKNSTIVLHDTCRPGEQITLNAMMVKLPWHHVHDFNKCSILTNLDISGMDIIKEEEDE